MKQSKPLLSIIIVSYNTKELLEKCLDSIVRSLTLDAENVKTTDQPYASNLKRHTSSVSYEIIVVDNHSTDGTREYLSNIALEQYSNIDKKRKQSKRLNVYKANANERSIPLKVIFNNDNLGFAKANNQGIKIAEGKYILLLNSDTIVKDRALEKMVSFLEKSKEFASLGPKLLNADGTPQPSLGKFPTLPVAAAMLFLEHFLPASLLRVRWSPKNEREGDWVMGAALLLRREVYEKIGGLDENIFMYMEEVEWCFRAKKAGFRVYFYPQAEIIHLGRGSSKSGKKEPILQIFRGLIYFYEKHQPSWKKEILLFLLKLKANLSFFLGILTDNSYLKKTYGEAKKIT